MNRPDTPQNSAADNSRPSGSSSPLDSAGPSGFQSPGGSGSPPNRELPGVGLNALNSANSFSAVKTSKGVPGWAIAAVASLAVVALAVSFMMLRAKGDTTANAESSRASAKASSSQPLPDSFQQKERAAAKAKGLTTDDYIPSVSEESRKLISKIPTYADTGRTLGPADAKVKIHLFTDFSCPMCAKFHAQSMARLEELAKSGKVQLVWHNFVIFEQYGSDKPARATLAAAKQGKLFEFADAAYNDLASPQDHAHYTDASVRTVAQKVGLDMAKFEADYASPEVAREASAEQQLAQSLGLSGTPAIMVGDAYLPGVAPTQVIENTIELQAREQ